MSRSDERLQRFKYGFVAETMTPSDLLAFEKVREALTAAGLYEDIDWSVQYPYGTKKYSLKILSKDRAQEIQDTLTAVGISVMLIGSDIVGFNPGLFEYTY